MYMKLLNLKTWDFHYSYIIFFYRKPDPNNDYGNGVGLVIDVAFGIMFILFAIAILIFVLRRRSSKISLFTLSEK